MLKPRPYLGVPLKLLDVAFAQARLGGNDIGFPSESEEHGNTRQLLLVSEPLAVLLIERHAERKQQVLLLSGCGWSCEGGLDDNRGHVAYLAHAVSRHPRVAINEIVVTCYNDGGKIRCAIWQAYSSTRSGGA
jgi:hypothetical protein